MYVLYLIQINYQIKYKVVVVLVSNS